MSDFEVILPDGTRMMSVKPGDRVALRIRNAHSEHTKITGWRPPDDYVFIKAGTVSAVGMLVHEDTEEEIGDAVEFEDGSRVMAVDVLDFYPITDPPQIERK